MQQIQKTLVSGAKGKDDDQVEMVKAGMCGDEFNRPAGLADADYPADGGHLGDQPGMVGACVAGGEGVVR